MKMTASEMRFFQNLYFTGARIRYIDESRHSPFKFSAEYHEGGRLEDLENYESDRELLNSACAFISKHEESARHSEKAFYVLRLEQVKICLFFD